MSNLETSRVTTAAPADPVVDPFTDPVGFLAAHGIEAELIEHVCPLPEAA
jgi:hypothetical protein